MALCLDVLERLGEVTGHAGVGGASEDARVLAGRRADLQECSGGGRIRKMRRGGGRRRMDELSGLSIILILPRGRQEGKEAETAGRSAMVVAARLENSLLQYSAVAAERQRLPFMPCSALT